MQQQSQPSTLLFGESEAPIPRGTFVRAARALVASFTRAAADPIEQPFHDSDFEAESEYFGRPLGEH